MAFATLVVLVVAIACIFLVPRKHLLTATLIILIIFPGGQSFLIGPFHFMLSRIVILACWLRLKVARTVPDQERFRLNALDKAVLAWLCSSALFFSLHYLDLAGIVNRLGFLYSTLGPYFLFRLLVRQREDVEKTIKTLAGICIVISIFMTCEQITGHNWFAVFGGVPAQTVIRDGRLRSQGPFGHAILAGTFGAILVPLFVSLWQGGSRLLGALSIGAALTVVITSASSTPLMALVAVIIGYAFWPLQNSMRMVRRCLALTTIALHLVMKAPVWSLIGRFDITGSSSGYHRYMLIDATIRHFTQWAFSGVTDTANWGWDMGDTANQYVETAVTGGLLTLVCFILVIVRCFGLIGSARRRSVGDPKRVKQLWSLGVAIFANTVAFIGISYFDQTNFVWLATIATVAAATAAVPSRTESPAVHQAESHWWQSAHDLART